MNVMLSTLPSDIQDLLHLSTLRKERRGLNLLVAGQPRSGKSAALGYFVRQIDDQDRSVVLEDRKASLDLLGLDGRLARLIGSPEYERNQMVSTAMHMRPDWIIADDLTEKDAESFVQASLTGYDTMFSIEASTPAKALRQLAVFVAAGSYVNGRCAMATRMVDAAAYVVVQVEKEAQGEPHVVSVVDAKPQQKLYEPVEYSLHTLYAAA